VIISVFVQHLLNKMFLELNNVTCRGVVRNLEGGFMDWTVGFIDTLLCFTIEILIENDTSSTYLDRICHYYH
jgi:hypothetical protein